MTPNFQKALDPTHQFRTYLLLKSRTAGPLPDSDLENILSIRLWRAFGFEKLRDYLRIELGLPDDRAADWVVTAINRDLESKELYGLPLPA